MKKCLFALLLMVFGFINAQEKYEVLAKLNNQEFTTDEFNERYLMIPRLSVGNKQDEPAFRAKAFYTMVAEKLWALYAREEGLDSSDIIKYTYKAIEKMYVRDALYNREIKDKARVDEKKIIFASAKIKRTLYVNFVFAKDSNEIYKIYYKLNAGESFDSLLNKRQDKNYQPGPVEVNFGMMREDIEDAIYSLTPGKYTKPLDYEGEYYIFRLTYEKPKEFKDNDEYKKEFNNAKKLVEDRALNKAYANYFNKLFVGKQINADGYLFWSIADRVIEAVKNRKVKDKTPDGNKITLAAEDFTFIENSLTKDTLQMEFVRFENEPVTVFQFLREFFYEGFVGISTNADTLRAQLQSRVKRFIEHEILSREGYKQGLQNLPEVKRSIDMWKDNYLSKLAKNHFVANLQLTDEDVKAYYEKNKGGSNLPLMVNIIEILTDNLEEMDAVMKLLEKGEDIKEVAKKYTKRETVKKNGGEFGYFAANMYGEIGNIAAGMKVGEIYGPIKIEEGYSIFKLIDKKESKENLLTKPFEEIKDSLRNIARIEQLKNGLEGKTIELAKKYNLKVDDNVLNNLKAENLNMLVYRYMGFGGRILAVPVDPLFTDWVENWQKEQKDLP
ncbi:MAG TPA: peptidyl-prolyl cis-trans isomerase [Melioribacteraceae bacterium]|nr:peptidyl-prolyl cis-trans isomerase [Melioribacteraceae bacterium]